MTTRTLPAPATGSQRKVGVVVVKISSFVGEITFGGSRAGNARSASVAVTALPWVSVTVTEYVPMETGVPASRKYSPRKSRFG